MVVGRKTETIVSPSRLSIWKAQSVAVVKHDAAENAGAYLVFALLRALLITRPVLWAPPPKSRQCRRIKEGPQVGGLLVGVVQSAGVK